MEAKWVACDMIDHGNGTKFCIYTAQSNSPRDRCIKHGRLLSVWVHGDFRTRAEARKHLLAIATAPEAR